MRSNFKLTYYIFLIFWSFIVISSEAILKQVHVLFRHGSRSPSRTYPNDPHINFKWSGGWGHLTNGGKLEMYNLGQILRLQYKHFLPELYWHEDVNISSSYSDRCLMSAELFAAGMFPPKELQIWNEELLWQPTPVNYLPRSQDNLLAMKSKCDKYDNMFKELLKSKKIQDIIKENEDLFTYLEEHTGMKLNDIEAVETLYATLEIEKLNNLTLPSWVNETLMHRMEELAALNLAIYSETEFMKRMKGGAYLRHVVTSMEDILEGKTKPILLLYSAHDLTIVHVLRSLNLVNTIRPSFGASLIFELYSDSEVKIIYRHSWDGIPEEKILSSCKAPCYLPDLKSSLKTVLPVNWKQECNATSQFKKEWEPRTL